MRWDRARRVAGAAPAALPAETRTLADAAGRALAAPLTALTDLPAFDTSAMDGWAVAGPGPWTLREDDIAVGRVPAALLPGTAGRIATGAPVPHGAWAVLRLEDGLVADGVLHAAFPLSQGRDIRPRGGECIAGTVLVEAGATVTPALLGLAAAAGHDGLRVHRHPAVRVLVTGDELLRSGIPADGMVRDALGPLLVPWLTAAGASLDGTTPLSDDPAALRSQLRECRADVIITTGSTSVGPTDLLHRLLPEEGARFLVDSVAVRPGHPMLLAALPPATVPASTGPASTGPASTGPASTGQSRWLVGLPGNPFAAVAGLVTLVLPLLRRLGGHRPPEPLCLPAAAPFPGHPADVCLVPAALSLGRLRPLPFDGPSMLRGIALAGFLAVVPPGGVAEGAPVEAIPFGG